MAKHRCEKKGCDRAVKHQGDFCWQHKGLADQVVAGAVQQDQQSVADAGQEAQIAPAVDEGGKVEADRVAEVGGKVEADRVADTDKIDAEISPVAASFEGEVEMVSPTESVLARLLRPVQLLSPLPPSTSMLLVFSEDEFSALGEKGITAEVIEELARLLLAGEIGRIVKVEDPIAKSRRRQEPAEDAA